MVASGSHVVAGKIHLLCGRWFSGGVVKKIAFPDPRMMRHLWPPSSIPEVFKKAKDVGAKKAQPEAQEDVEELPDDGDMSRDEADFEEPEVNIMEILQQEEVPSPFLHIEDEVWREGEAVTEEEDLTEDEEGDKLEVTEQFDPIANTSDVPGFISFRSQISQDSTVEDSILNDSSSQDEPSGFFSFMSQGSQDSTFGMDGSNSGLPSTSTPLPSRAPSPSPMVRQRRSRRTSEVLDDFQSLNLKENPMVMVPSDALESSVFAEPVAPTGSASKKKRTSGQYDPSSAASLSTTKTGRPRPRFVPPPDEDACMNLSAFREPRRSLRRSSTSDSSTEEPDFSLRLSDSTWVEDPQAKTSTPLRSKQPQQSTSQLGFPAMQSSLPSTIMSAISTSSQAHVQAQTSFFRRPGDPQLSQPSVAPTPSSPVPTSSQAKPSLSQQLAMKVTPAMTRSKSKQSEKSLDGFNYKCQFVNFKANCWHNGVCWALSIVMKESNVELDAPAEADEAEWTYEDHFCSWYSQDSPVTIHPKEALIKLVESFEFNFWDTEDEKAKKRWTLMNEHMPSETLLELLENSHLIDCLRPTIEDELIYEVCKCGHLRAKGKHKVERHLFFQLRAILGLYDSVHQMMLEELKKTTFSTCPACGSEDVKCHITRRFKKPVDGFIAVINRSKWTRVFNEEKGEDEMVQVKHCIEYLAFLTSSSANWSFYVAE